MSPSVYQAKTPPHPTNNLKATTLVVANNEHDAHQQALTSIAELHIAETRNDYHAIARRTLTRVAAAIEEGRIE